MITIDGKNYFIKIKDKNYHCAVSVTMDIIGGKWKAVVLWYLKNEKKRFSDLKKLIPDITEKMLIQQLKELEKNGIVKRKVYPVVPPKVEYSLTEYGKKLIPLLIEIAEFGKKHAKQNGKLIEIPLEK